MRCSDLTEQDILEKWRVWYEENISMDAKLPPKGSQCIPGPASALFKDKDTYPSSKLFKDCRVRQLCKFRKNKKLTHSGKLLEYATLYALK